ncbi:unnamed protein product [Cyclocybe aegerita]|uniref:Transcription factor CBF/NF-Y/archaeal histone domain-containing protein n=1 Tax=Cyclocybe aegerita TaxID=1973307 RepID=A0A8S0XG55_CYCAE|nr:unnamed protein product [Cyclocybe aegerita]
MSRTVAGNIQGRPHFLTTAPHVPISAPFSRTLNPSYSTICRSSFQRPMSSFVPDVPPPFLPHSVTHPYESDVEADLEVDQLDSDTDPEDQRDPAKASAAKVTSTRPGERVPGHTLLPAVRIENMIQADGGTGHLALSKEGLFILSTASEEFIKRLIQAAHREAAAHRRNQINYPDMAATTRQYQEFMFLSETIPPPIPLIDALMLRQEKERVLLEDNPALAAPSPIPSWPPSVSDIPPSQPTSSTSKPSKKPRPSVNGKEKSNGSHSTSKRGSKRMESSTYPMDDPRIHASLGGTGGRDSPSGASDFMSDPPPSHRTSGRNGTSSLSASAVSLHPPSINGQPSRSQTPQVYSREGSLDPNAHAQPHYPATHSASPPLEGPEEPAWPPQYTGPASGFLRGSVGPFGRGPSHNPGRTIYSQNHHPD